MTLIIGDTKRIANHITMKVELKRYQGWLWRVKLGMLLIRLAAWIMWVDVEIKDAR